MGVRGAGGRVRRIAAALAVHVVELLGPRVVRLQVLVGDRPRGRDPAVMLDLPEVLAPQPEERGAVELRVAADIVVRVRVELPTVPVAPYFLGGVLALEVHGPRIPVVLLAGHVITALEDEDLLARRREGIRERAASGAGADDRDVVAGRHVLSSVTELGIERHPAVHVDRLTAG